MTNREIVLSFLLGATAALAGFAWDKILLNPYWVFAVLGYSLAFAAFLVLVRHIYAKWIVSVGSVIPFAVFFKIDAYWIAGLVLSVLIVAFAVLYEIEDEEASIKIIIKRRIGPTTKLFFTGLAVFLSFVYFSGVNRDPNPERMILPESIFKVTLKLLESPLQGTIPGFRAEATTGELFNSQERQVFAQQFGLKLTGKEKISDVLYVVVLERIKTYAGDYLNYVPVFAALSYFLALKTVSVIFYYFTVVLISIILKLLLMGGIIQKAKIPAEREIYI